MVQILNSEEKSHKMNQEKCQDIKKIIACCLVCIGGFSQGVIFGWNIPFLSQMKKDITHSTNASELQIESYKNLTQTKMLTELYQNRSSALLIQTKTNMTGYESLSLIKVELAEDITSPAKVEQNSKACSSNLSWISSSQNLGSIFGALLSGPLLLLFHPHHLIPVLSLATSLSWFLTAHNPDSSLWITIGKGLVGLFITLQANYSPKYITSTAPKEYASTLSCMFVVARNLGLVLTASSNLYLGSDNSWIEMTYMFGVAPPLIMTCFFFLLPATNPSKNKDTEKVNNVIIDLENGENSKNKKIIVIKTTFHLLILVSSMSLSGVVPISSFVSYFLKSPSSFVNVYSYSASTASLSFLVCGFLGSVISTMISSRVGTRSTLLITTLLLAMSTSVISIYYILLPGYTKPYHTIHHQVHALIYYIPLVSFNVFFLAFGVGIGTLFSVILGDILPKSGQPLTYPLIFGWLHTLNFVQNYCFPQIVCQFQFYGIGTTFVFHSCINIVSFIFVYYQSNIE